MNLRLMHRHAATRVGRMAVACMSVTVVVVVIIVVTTHMRMTAVSAGFGFKGRHDLMRMGTEAVEHLGQHVIGANAQGKVPILLAANNLHRRVAVAQVIRATREFVGVMALNFKHRFGGGEYAHDTIDALIIHAAQAIASAQHGIARQKQGGLITGSRAAGQGGALAALLAQFVGKGQFALHLCQRGNAFFQCQHDQNRK